MGFFGLDDTPPPKPKSGIRGVNVEALREAGCKLCPFDQMDCKSPKMKPYGSTKPTVYILGDAPSKDADARGVPIAGDVGRFIRSSTPESFRDMIRMNNVIRTHPGEGEKVENADGELIYTKMPDEVAIECCRPSVREDILKHKPAIVITIGKVPLRWIADETHAYLWQGRRFPAEMDGHTFWVYPFQHPYDVMKSRRWKDHRPDDEITWHRHFRQVFKDIEADDIAAPAVHTEKDARKNISWVMGDSADDLKRIEKFLADCADDKLIGMDYETSCIRPYQKDATILSVALTNKRETLAWPIDHKEAEWSRKQKDMLDDMWLEFLEHPDIIKVAHQASFEMEWSAFYWGEDVCRAGQWEDTISQAYVLNSRQMMLGLEVLTQQYYGINIKKLSTVNRKKMAEEPLIKILPYNGMDAKYHRKLFLKQAPIIRDLGLQDVYAHQMARIPTLVLTQLQGIPIDQNELKEFRKKYEIERDKALDALKALPCWDEYRKSYDAEFRPSATRDVAKMFKVIGVKYKSTDEKILRQINHPFASALLKWRKPTKLLSTYCDGVTAGEEGSHIMPDGMVHPIISSYKVETWRTSSEDPNIQNWHKRGAYVALRRIVTKRGKKVVTFDYAGIQARNIAMESADRNFVQSFIEGYDIHTAWVTAFAEAFPKWAPRNLLVNKEVFKDTRTVMKNKFVFAALFGGQAKSITPDLNSIANKQDLRVEQVQEMLEQLFEKFPGIYRWQQSLKDFYAKHGYVSGLSGFRRHAPINYNQLINSPIQADETIIVLSAMNALSELNYKRYQPMMEIHDDLTFLWPEDEVDKRAEIVIREMLKIRFDWINVPLVVEMSVGDNWCDIKRVGDYESVGTDGDFRQLKK